MYKPSLPQNVSQDFGDHFTIFLRPKFVYEVGVTPLANSILKGLYQWLSILLGRPRLRCEDNIRMDLKEIWRESVDLMHLTQDRDQWRALVNTVTKLRVV